MNKVITFIFVVAIATFASLLLILPKEVYSDDENRYLATFPSFSFKKVKSGKWMEEIEVFVDDQFPARLKWIELKTNIDLALGKIESNGVYLTGEGHYIESFKKYDESVLKDNIEALNEFATILKNQFQMELQVMPVPTAATILQQELPKYNIEINQIKAIQNLQGEAFQLIDVGEALLKHKDEYIYYYTDHHWTSLGAYYAYQHWKPDTVPLSSYMEEKLSEEFLGTLYSKVKVEPSTRDTMTAYYFNRPQQVEYNLDGQLKDTFYEREYLAKKDKYSVYFKGNQPVTKIAGYGEEGKLLIVKDSYANTFAQFAVADYAEVHMVDLRNFNVPLSQYVEMMQIDEVLVLYNYKNLTEDTNLYLLR